VTGRRGRRRQLLYDKKTRGYWKMKEEAVDRSLWRTGFGREYGLARHTVGWVNECTRPIRRVSKSFWISWEPVAWPWCNLAASQRRPYCAKVDRHSPVGLVSRQWDAVDWACVMFDRRIHNDRASRSANLYQCACPFYSSHAGFFFLAKLRITLICQNYYNSYLSPCDFWFYPTLKSPLKVRIFVNATVTQYTSSVNGVSLPTD